MSDSILPSPRSPLHLGDSIVLRTMRSPTRRDFLGAALAVATAATPCSIARLVTAETASAAATQSATTSNAEWMRGCKYGLFMHYQHRILLGRSVATRPQFPSPGEMTADGWNRFVDGFDVNGLAKQAAEGKVGWFLFCIDDHYYAWPAWQDLLRQRVSRPRRSQPVQRPRTYRLDHHLQPRGRRLHPRLAVRSQDRAAEGFRLLTAPADR